MPSAVAAVVATPSRNPPATSASSEGSGLDALSSQGFASLLRGQMQGGKSGEGTEAAQANATDAEAGSSVAPLIDPAQLLAEMGLTSGIAIAPLPTATQAANAPRLAAADGEQTTALLPAAGEPGALTDGLQARTPALAANALPEATSHAGIQATGGRRPAGGESAAELNSNTAGASEPEAAKVAGFAQQLTEKLPGTHALESSTGPEAPPAQALSAAGTPVAAHANRESLSVQTPVRERGWDADFGQKIVWMAKEDKQAAQITLNPPQLGPIEISLNVRNDQATAVFASPSAEVREAIESALPRLREMLAGVGIELGQANVNAESFRQAQEDAANRSFRRDSASRSAGDDRSTAIGAVMTGSGTTRIQRGNGLVDTFA